MASYTLTICGRGEDIKYSDSHGELWLQRTYCNGDRLYCDDTAQLPFDRRREIILNLCHYFDTITDPMVFVLDIADKDRSALEVLFLDLTSQGHQLTIESDSAAIRERATDERYLDVVRAGKILYVGCIEIRTEDEYWQWKGRGRKHRT